MGFEGRKNVHSFLQHKDLQAIGKVGSQKVTSYVCFSMKIQMVKFRQKAKRAKSFPLAPPVPNKVKEGGILIHELLPLDSNVRAKLTIMLKIKKFSKSFLSQIETLNKNSEKRNCNDIFIQFRFIVSQSL